MASRGREHAADAGGREAVERPRRRRGRSRKAQLARDRAIQTLTLCVLSAALAGAVTWRWAQRAPGPARPATAADAVHADPRATPPGSYSWTAQPTPQFPIPPYAKFLKEATVVLDPGHVGQRDRPGYKRGPTGLREAAANLSVTLFLRDFLEAAGARVILTRERDESLNLDDDDDLRDRAEIANRANADLLLSIHHNAADSNANFTTLFYHGDAGENPASADAARWLLGGLNDALRLDTHIGCAIQSDYSLFGSGLAVLRQAAVPAVLSEASFHTNPDEEERLRDPVYNRREAYGLFLGLARWAQAGLPRVRMVQPTSGAVRAGQPLVVKLEDGLSHRGGMGDKLLKIRAPSLRVEWNGSPVAYRVNWGTREVTLTPTAEMLRGAAELRVDFANAFGQHVLRPVIEVKR